jgi:hypothetical protein
MVIWRILGALPFPAPPLAFRKFLEFCAAPERGFGPTVPVFTGLALLDGFILRRAHV